MRPTTPFIERVQNLWPHGSWAAYPDKPDPQCWVSTPSRPAMKYQGVVRHPVAAFFIHLGGEPGKFKLKVLCRNPYCANPYHFYYDLTVPHVSADALQHAVDNDTLPEFPSFLVDGKTWEEFLELCEGEYTEEEAYSLFHRTPQHILLQHGQRRASFCTEERAAAFQQEHPEWHRLSN